MLPSLVLVRVGASGTLKSLGSKSHVAYNRASGRTGFCGVSFPFVCGTSLTLVASGVGGTASTDGITLAFHGAGMPFP
jgi:hypothetical protein